MQTWTLIDFGPGLTRAQRVATVIAKTPDDAAALAPGTCAMAFPVDRPAGMAMIPTSRPVWSEVA